MAEKYVDALKGISFSDWIKVKIAVDRMFENIRREYEKEFTLSDPEYVKKLIRSQFE